MVDDDPVAQMCVRWDGYEALLASDREPSDELIDELLERQRGIEEVLPAELASEWGDITRWTGAFVEYLSAAGYGDIDDDAIVTIFGDEATAEAAADAMDDGVSAMNGWSARNCARGSGDARSFCTAWTEMSGSLDLLDEGSPTAQEVDELFDTLSAAGPDVPIEVRGDWDSLVAFVVPYRDVLVTVEYELDRVSDDLLAEAFGTVADAERLRDAARASRDAIDAWSLDGCGDFCTRWGETSEAIDWLGHDLGWVNGMGDEGPRQLATMQARLDVATRQVPDELRDDWELLMIVLDDWSGWWESLDFDHQRVIGTEGRAAAAEIARRAPYFADLAFEMFDPPDDRATFDASLASWRDDELAGTWQGVVEYAVSTVAGGVHRWTEEHCDAEGGLPGRVRVTWPEIEGAAGSTIVLAVVPVGSTVDDLGDVEARSAGYCEAVSSDPWGVEFDPEGNVHHLESGWFMSGSPEGRDNAGFCEFDWEDGPVVLDAGPYTLLAVMVPGGETGRTLAATPTACAAVDIEVDGDTTIDLEPLPACGSDLVDLVADPGWGTSDPVDPATPGAGTLRVTVPSLTVPDDIEGRDGGELSIVVLPAGTTLNDVGRQEIWPSGGFRQFLEPQTGDERIQELRRLGAVALPITPVPSTGTFGGFDPWWLAGADDDVLGLVVLAPGSYDVYVEIVGHSEDVEDRRCGSTTVTIDGDTVIDMPELGVCP